MGKTVVITAGGTNEKIDEVRKITNMSTGKLGYQICKELINQKGELINKIYYICPTNAVQPFDVDKVEILNANGTSDVQKIIEEILLNQKVDYFIHSMAVSDYTTDYVSNAGNLSDEITSVLLNHQSKLSKDDLNEIIEGVIKKHSKAIDRSSKISSSEDNLLIKLKPTPKIISEIKNYQPSTFLVGFKLLNGVSQKELFNVAYSLLEKNKCDLVVANDLKSIRNGLHTAMLIKPDKSRELCYGKDQIAKKLIEHMWEQREMLGVKYKSN